MVVVVPCREDVSRFRVSRLEPTLLLLTLLQQLPFVKRLCETISHVRRCCIHAVRARAVAGHVRLLIYCKTFSHIFVRVSFVRGRVGCPWAARRFVCSQ